MDKGDYNMLYNLLADAVNALFMISSGIRLPIYIICNVEVRREVRLYMSALFCAKRCDFMSPTRSLYFVIYTPFMNVFGSCRCLPSGWTVDEENKRQWRQCNGTCMSECVV